MIAPQPPVRAIAAAVAALLAILFAPGPVLAQIAPPEPAPGADRVAVEGNAVLAPGTFNLLDPAAGLAALPSYRASLVLSFAGTMDGRPYQWTETHELEVAAPTARRLTVTTEGLPDTPARLVALTIGATLWERADDGACTAIAAAAAPAEAMEPAALLPAFIGADAAGQETIAGIATLHYTFDERALGDTGVVARAEGEVWVAADGGQIVRYRLLVTAGADYFGAGIEGAATLEYDLTGVGQPVAAIEVPADCPPGLVELPLPGEIVPEVNLPGLLAYATPLLAADVIAFYREQLPALGWEEQPALFEDEAATVLEFTAGGQRLVLRVAADATATRIELVLSRL